MTGTLRAHTPGPMISNFGSTFDGNDYADGGGNGSLSLTAATPTSLEFNGTHVKDFQSVNLTGAFNIVFDRNFIDWSSQSGPLLIVRSEGFLGSDPVSLDFSANGQGASTVALVGAEGNDT